MYSTTLFTFKNLFKATKCEIDWVSYRAVIRGGIQTLALRLAEVPCEQMRGWSKFFPNIDLDIYISVGP